MPGDHLRRWSAAGRRDAPSASPATCPTGSRRTARGGSLACEHATSQVTRTEPDGRIVAARHALPGQAAQQPQRHRRARRTAASTSAIRPTAAPKFYGVERAAGARLPGRVPGRARIPKSPALLVDDFDRPNGLCFSLDGARLFVNDTARKHIRVFDVTARRRPRRRPRVGGDEGRRAGRARRHEARLGRQRVLLRAGRHPRLRARARTSSGSSAVPEYTANFAWGDDDSARCSSPPRRRSTGSASQVPGLPRSERFIAPRADDSQRRRSSC